jgi:beta-galactosidase
MKTVGYDPRAITIDGKRHLLLAGAIHYPRATPDTWPELFRLSKQAGLNAIETYVFWNVHEPQPGVFDFSGRLDLKRFCRLAQEAGLSVILRVGPFVCAEVNYGGLPFWLRNVPGMQMRTNNEPFKREMARWVRFLCGYLAEEFYPNGGPIIMAQIENEYFLIEKTYGAEGQKYLDWCVSLTKSLNLGIPWVMCLGGVPGALETINACYGHQLLEKHFAGHPDQPAVWTENWQSWYETWGHPRHIRVPENSAYSTARFFAEGGTGNNYYMWHGGTNFGRETMYLQTTSYDCDAPLDEYGQPTSKYHHLARLHRILNDFAGEILNHQRPTPQVLGANQKAFVYGPLAFLCNDDTAPAEVSFRDKTYRLAGQSVVLLERGRVLMDTSRIAPADVVRRTFKPLSGTALSFRRWAEPLPGREGARLSAKPVDQLQFTDDLTDYCWYSTKLAVPARQAGRGELTLRGVADYVYVYVDGRLCARTQPPLIEERGRLDGEAFTQTFTFSLTPGAHRLSLLCCGLGLIKGDWLIGGQNMVLERKGLWGSAAWNGTRLKGPWEIRPGLTGEQTRVFAEAGQLVKWSDKNLNKPLSWLRTAFARPKGTGPWALDLQGMDKGMIWLNGRCLGRYWLALAGEARPENIQSHEAILDRGAGRPTQQYYRIPDAWLADDNTLVLWEEAGGDPSRVQLCRRK